MCILNLYDKTGEKTPKACDRAGASASLLASIQDSLETSLQTMEALRASIRKPHRATDSFIEYRSTTHQEVAPRLGPLINILTGLVASDGESTAVALYYKFKASLFLALGLQDSSVVPTHTLRGVLEAWRAFEEAAAGYQHLLHHRADDAATVLFSLFQGVFRDSPVNAGDVLYGTASCILSLLFLFFCFSYFYIYSFPSFPLSSSHHTSHTCTSHTYTTPASTQSSTLFITLMGPTLPSPHNHSPPRQSLCASSQALIAADESLRLNSLTWTGTEGLLSDLAFHLKCRMKLEDMNTHTNTHPEMSINQIRITLDDVTTHTRSHTHNGEEVMLIAPEHVLRLLAWRINEIMKCIGVLRRLLQSECNTNTIAFVDTYRFFPSPAAGMDSAVLLVVSREPLALLLLQLEAHYGTALSELAASMKKHSAVSQMTSDEYFHYTPVI